MTFVVSTVVVVDCRGERRVERRLDVTGGVEEKSGLRGSKLSFLSFSARE